MQNFFIPFAIDWRRLIYQHFTRFACHADEKVFHWAEYRPNYNQKEAIHGLVTMEAILLPFLRHGVAAIYNGQCFDWIAHLIWNRSPYLDESRVYCKLEDY